MVWVCGLQLAVLRTSVCCIQRIQPLKQLHTARQCLRGRRGGSGSIGDVVASFKEVSFSYGPNEILDEADFSIREGSKVTIMGQNGAGKSSIIKLLAGSLMADGGAVNIEAGAVVSTAKQTMPPENREMTVEECVVHRRVAQYFGDRFKGANIHSWKRAFCLPYWLPLRCDHAGYQAPSQF
jgi:ATPase subunit of ABC transporter with duplicated ATPase domains